MTGNVQNVQPMLPPGLPSLNFGGKKTGAERDATTQLLEQFQKELLKDFHASPVAAIYPLHITMITIDHSMSVGCVPVAMSDFIKD